MRTTLTVVVLGCVLFALAALAAGGGCSDRVLRESVLASTQSTIGLAVGQNPRTGLYEGSLGFARAETFIVPTGKRVVNARGEGGADDADAAAAMTSARADTTPEVLGEILTDGEFGPGAGVGGALGRVGVYQRLAVGRVAVCTPAAIALLAREGAAADRAEVSLDELAGRSAGAVFVLRDGGGGTRTAGWSDAADAWSRELGFAGYEALCADGAEHVKRTLAARWEAELALAGHAARAGRPARR